MRDVHTMSADAPRALGVSPVNEAYAPPIGDPSSHEVLRELLKRHRPGRALDAPAGYGGITRFLMDRGWDVRPADVDPGLFQLDDVDLTLLDLNHRLPFSDQEFDLVVCANAIHRIYNISGVIREFHRVLRPGGTLYINMRNYAHILCRVRFFITGSLDTRVNEGGAQQTIVDPAANVRAHVLYPQVANAMERAGFTVETVQAAAVRRSNRLLAPLALPMRLLGRLVPKDRARRDHVRMMNSPALCPGGRYICVAATRNGP
jgi:SAM-dependent methyltransferase